MRICNNTDETIVIPPDETISVSGDNKTRKTMVKRVPILVVNEVRNQITVQ